MINHRLLALAPSIIIEYPSVRYLPLRLLKVHQNHGERVFAVQ